MLVFEAPISAEEKALFLLEAGGPRCSTRLPVSRTRGPGFQRAGSCVSPAEGHGSAVRSPLLARDTLDPAFFYF